MSLTTLCSAKGSPGTTTLAACLALEFARGLPGPGAEALLVECDPHGGDLAFMLDLDPLPGLPSLALAGRHHLDLDLMLEHAQTSRLLNRVAVVPGVAGVEQGSAMTWLAAPLALAAADAKLPVVADVGRLSLGAETMPLFEEADSVLVVCGTTTASLVHARAGLASLVARGIDCAGVVVGEAADRADALATALGQPVAGVIPREGRSAHPSARSANWPSLYGSRMRDAVRLLAKVLVDELSPLAAPAEKIESAPPFVTERARGALAIASRGPHHLRVARGEVRP